MNNRVFVLDKNKNPLMPCHPARARQLLKDKKAAVFRRLPFTIILKEREGGATQQLQLKFDPGSKTTGIAIVGEFQRGKRCIFAAELTHRSWKIKKALEQRRDVRRSRRNRKTRYRKPRFNNRTRPKGWLHLQQKIIVKDWVSTPLLERKVLLMTLNCQFRGTRETLASSSWEFYPSSCDSLEIRNLDISGAENLNFPALKSLQLIDLIMEEEHYAWFFDYPYRFRTVEGLALWSVDVKTSQSFSNLTFLNHLVESFPRLESLKFRGMPQNFTTAATNFFKKSRVVVRSI